MTRMVVQVFESRLDADGARTALMAEGFDDACIHVEGADADSSRNTNTVDNRDRPKEPFWAHTEKRGLVGVIERMFSGLLNDDDDYVRYTRALRSGKSVVAVHVHDQGAAARAAWILKERTRTPTGETGAAIGSPPPGPQIYPLPNAPTGWGQSTRGADNTLGERTDPGRPEGLLRDAKGLGTDDTERVMHERRTGGRDGDRARK